MEWLIGYFVALAVALLFNRGAHRKPTPKMRVLYLVPDERGGADATGPAPSP